MRCAGAPLFFLVSPSDHQSYTLSPMADLDIPVGYGLWSFELQHAGIQHTAIVTLGFKVSAPPYTQTHNDAALSRFRTSCQAIHDSEVVYSRVVALIGNDGPLLRFESTGNSTGARVTQNIMSPNNSYLIRKVTAFSGRRFRGRLFLPFVSSFPSVGQNGQLSSAEQTLLTGVCTALPVNLIGSPTNVSEFSLLHAAGLTALPSPTPITSLNADDFVATQRRRLVRS